MDLENLIMRISYFRYKKELSARELSLRINKSDTYITQVENKNFTISLPVLFDIIQALDITSAEFFADNYRSYEQDKQIIGALSALSDDMKKSFLTILLDKAE